MIAKEFEDFLLAHLDNYLIPSDQVTIFIGVLGTLFKPKNYRIYTKEGMLIVALCWVLWSFFGGLPFVLPELLISCLLHLYQSWR